MNANLLMSKSETTIAQESQKAMSVSMAQMRQELAIAEAEVKTYKARMPSDDERALINTYR